MRRVIVVVLLLCFFCWACTEKVPKDIIPKTQMETIIWQMIQSDEYVTYQLRTDSTKKPHDERMKIYQKVCDLNHISLDDFKKSFRYYMDRPDIAKIMFDSLSDRTSRMRNEIYQVTPPAPAPSKPAAAK